jgi:hypothetical protein
MNYVLYFLKYILSLFLSGITYCFNGITYCFKFIFVIKRNNNINKNQSGGTSQTGNNNIQNNTQNKIFIGEKNNDKQE